MNVQRNLLVLMTLAAVASPALGQVIQTPPAARPTNGGSKSAVASPASGQQTAPAARQSNGGSKGVVASPAAGQQAAASAAGQTKGGPKGTGRISSDAVHLVISVTSALFPVDS
jgi:hypothetical protein